MHSDASSRLYCIFTQMVSFPTSNDSQSWQTQDVGVNPLLCEASSARGLSGARPLYLQPARREAPAHTLCPASALLLLLLLHPLGQ